MAAKKTAPAEEVKAEEQEVKETPAKEAPAENLQQENDDLKKLMLEMNKTLQQMQSQIQAQQEQIEKMASGEAAPQRPKTQAEVVWEEIHEKDREVAEAGGDPWQVEVEMFVPHRDPGEDRWYWFRINDRTVQIPANDSRQKMKLPYALILADTLKAKHQEEEFIDSIQVYDPKDNPHQGRP